MERDVDVTYCKPQVGIKLSSNPEDIRSHVFSANGATSTPTPQKISQNPKPVTVVYVCHPNVWETDAGGLLMSEGLFIGVL